MCHVKLPHTIQPAALWYLLGGWLSVEVRESCGGVEIPSRALCYFRPLCITAHWRARVESLMISSYHYHYPVVLFLQRIGIRFHSSRWCVLSSHYSPKIFVKRHKTLSCCTFMWCVFALDRSSRIVWSRRSLVITAVGTYKRTAHFHTSWILVLFDQRLSSAACPIYLHRVETLKRKLPYSAPLLFSSVEKLKMTKYRGNSQIDLDIFFFLWPRKLKIFMPLWYCFSDF